MTGLGQLAIPLGEDGRLVAVQLVRRGYVPDFTVQPDLVVMRHVIRHQSPGVVEAQRRAWSNALSLERLVLAFELAVALRIVRRRSHMRHAVELARRPDRNGGRRSVMGTDRDLSQRHVLLPHELVGFSKFLLKKSLSPDNHQQIGAASLSKNIFVTGETDCVDRIRRRCSGHRSSAIAVPNGLQCQSCDDHVSAFWHCKRHSDGGCNPVACSDEPFSPDGT